MYVVCNITRNFTKIQAFLVVHLFSVFSVRCFGKVIASIFPMDREVFHIATHIEEEM
jgi:hypothetical protein